MAPTRSPRTPRQDGDVADQVMEILSRYVSTTTAASALVSARRRAPSDGPFDRSCLRDALSTIERSLRLFLADPMRVEACLSELRGLASVPGGPAALPHVLVPVRVETDVVRARNEARDMAVPLGFSLTGRTRLATAVSELARNIVLYAGEGEIEIVRTLPPGLEVVARDRGPGIPNLEEILSGNYRSKLGMGRGLLAVRELADVFDVDTGAGRGTRVRFVLRVR